MWITGWACALISMSLLKGSRSLFWGRGPSSLLDWEFSHGRGVYLPIRLGSSPGRGSVSLIRRWLHEGRGTVSPRQSGSPLTQRPCTPSRLRGTREPILSPFLSHDVFTQSSLEDTCRGRRAGYREPSVPPPWTWATAQGSLSVSLNRVGRTHRSTGDSQTPPPLLHVGSQSPPSPPAFHPVGPASGSTQQVHPAGPARSSPETGLVSVASLPTLPVTKAADLAPASSPAGTLPTCFSPLSFHLCSIPTNPSLGLEPSGSI